MGRGDAGVLAELHRRHHADVARFVRSRWPAGPVEDVCQDVWLAAQRALPDFRGESTALVWLFSIAKNRVLDLQRRPRPAEPPPDLELLVESLPLGPRRATGARSALLRRERAQALGGVLAAWPEGDRRLLELRYLTGLRPAQIVEVLELPEPANTMAQRLRRLVLRLRRELAGHEAFS